ncbi:hypothetical protein [Rhizomonospora bruguierae]|uniref:hypothetical protein n=1 Tax=Rhizomonospora bruguierae TaxID=1581705 RepID=UPI001BCF05B1|nr:hypothetical protein [Micromonospora sp. NBRC 107566]
MAVECINWGVYDVPRIWQMVAGENDERGWAQVTAWYRLQSATDAQRERLVECRRSLEHRWPPTHSEAARLFVEYLSGLIDSMDETAKAAASTARGLSGIMHALARAKAQIEPIHEEWQRVANDWKPEFLFKDQEPLNRQARAIMTNTDREIIDYAAMIRIPQKYREPSRIDGGTPLDPPPRMGDNHGDSDAANAGSGGGQIRGTYTNSLPPIQHDPPAPLAPGDVPNSRQDAGPALAGSPSAPNHPVAPNNPPAPDSSRNPNAVDGWSPSTALGRSTKFDGATIRPNHSIVKQVAQPREYRPIGSARITEPIGDVPNTRGAHGDSISGGPINGMSTGRGNQRRRHRVRIEEEWTTRQGVPPVIEPSIDEPYHGPGPSVIGIDH